MPKKKKKPQRMDPASAGRTEINEADQCRLKCDGIHVSRVHGQTARRFFVAARGHDTPEQVGRQFHPAPYG